MPTPRSLPTSPITGLPPNDDQPVLVRAGGRHPQRRFAAGLHRVDGAALQGAAVSRIEPADVELAGDASEIQGRRSTVREVDEIDLAGLGEAEDAVVVRRVAD